MKKLTVLMMVVGLGMMVVAENIDPYESGEQYAWSENTGWLNFEPSSGEGVQVAGDKVTGWVWGENIGWINLSCENTGYCGTVDFGVVNDGTGKLSGFAWAENVGWINFDPYYPGEPKANPYRVTIDDEGKFHGWAWGENIGWINFDDSQSWDVRVCIVSLEDFVKFASYWLEVGTNLPADLDSNNKVDLRDFNIFAEYWKDYCPNGWMLK